MNDRFKAALSAGLVFLLGIGFTGCFSMMTLSRAVPNIQNPVFTDTIVAIGQPDESALKKIGNPHALFFLGEQRSYFLAEGGETLVNIAKKLDGNLIEMKSDSRSMYIKDEQIWGSIVLTYDKKNNNEINNNELATLADLGFSKKLKGMAGFEKVITVKGVIYPRVYIPASQLNNLQKRRSISFYNPPSSVVVPSIQKVVLMPVAIAADVVTSPLQLLGVVFLVLVFKDMH